MSVWKYTVQGWGKIIQDESEHDILVKRDGLVKLLRGSDWYNDQDDPEKSDLEYAIKDLEDAVENDDIDNALWEIYNLADNDKAWLDPFADDEDDKE